MSYDGQVGGQAGVSAMIVTHRLCAEYHGDQSLPKFPQQSHPDLKCIF
jgi:hypothetical protein